MAPFIVTVADDRSWCRSRASIIASVALVADHASVTMTATKSDTLLAINDWVPSDGVWEPQTIPPCHARLE